MKTRPRENGSFVIRISFAVVLMFAAACLGLFSFAGAAAPQILHSASTLDSIPLGDPSRFRITSKLGAGSCEGLPITDVSIGPNSIAVSHTGKIAFYEYNNGLLVRTIDDAGNIKSVAWALNTNAYYEGLSRLGLPNDIPGLARVTSIVDLAYDRYGHVLVLDGVAGRIFAVDGNSAVVVAGSGAPEADIGGDSGLATDASFGNPQSISVDEAGDIYVTDQFNAASDRTDTGLVIRFINMGCTPRTFYAGTADEMTVAPHHIATIAGGGTDTAEGAAALNVDLGLTRRVTADAQGNLVFSSTRLVGVGVSSQIRAINTNASAITMNSVTIQPGTVQTLAGAGLGSGVDQDGIPAKLADLNMLASSNVAIDGQGSLFFGQFTRNNIKTVDVEGIITTYAGTGTLAYSPPGGNRLTTNLPGPTDLFFGPDGTLFYADAYDFAIRAIDANGVVRQVAGNGLYRYCGDGRPAVSDNVLYEPQAQNNDLAYGMSATADAAGNIYFTDRYNNVVRKIDIDTGILSTVVGKAIPCGAAGCAGTSTGDGGPYNQALLNFPFGLAADSHGLFISEGNQRVRYANFSSETVRVLGVDIAAGKIDIVAGPILGATTGSFCSADPYNFTTPPPGTVAKARGACVGPLALALAPNGDLIFTEYFNRSAVWRVNANGDLLLVAGRSAANGYGVVSDPNYDGCPDTGGEATQFPMCGPTSLAFDELGNLYIGQQLSTYDPNRPANTTAVERVDYINLGAAPVSVHGKTVAPGFIERVAGGKITADAFTGACTTSKGDGGSALDAELCALHGVAARGGLLVFSDSWNARLRVVDQNGTIFTFAGAGSPISPAPFSDIPDPSKGAYAGDGGTAFDARLMLPGQLFTPGAGDGFLLVSDDDNYRLRMIVDCQGAGAGTPICSATPAPAPSVAPRATPTQVTSPKAVSRKTHGPAGTYDVDLPLSGAAGIECRRGGATGDYQIVVTFPAPITFCSVGLTIGNGSIASSTTNSDGSEVTINLTGVSNAQTAVITLFDVNDGITFGNLAVPIGVLLGDTNGDGSVNSADISQTKSQSGQAVSSSNFREDVTADGSINSADISLVKSKSGTALP